MVALIQNGFMTPPPTKWDGGRARLNSRRRLGRATAAQRLGFRQYSREDSERARQARFESSRDHRARTDRSPVIGLSSTAQPGVDDSETGGSTLETPAGAVKSVVVCVLG